MPNEAAAVAPAPTPAAQSDGGNSVVKQGVDAAKAAQPTEATKPTSPVGQEPTQEQKEAAEQRYLTRKLKMNGQEREVKATEEELWASYRQVESVNERFRQLAEQRKSIEAKEAEMQQRLQAFQQALVEDPYLLLRQQDPNFDEQEYLTRRLHERLTQEPEDPRTAKLRQHEAALLEREAKLNAFEQQRQAEAQHAEEMKALNETGAILVKSLQGIGLPKDDATLDIAARTYFSAKEGGIDLTPEEIGAETMRVIVSQHEALAEKLSDDDLLDRFPKWSARIHKAIVERYKKRQAGGQTQPPPQPQQPRPPQNGAQKPKTEAELHREMENLAGRRFLRGI